MRIKALHTFMQRVENRPRLLVKVETDEGVSGWGEAYNHGPDWALVPILEYLFKQVEGMDARQVEYICQRNLQSSRFPPGALGLAAISALDNALWDAKGKAAGLPVYQLLGGKVRDRVCVYSSLEIAPDVAELRNLTAQLHADYGFTAFKLSPFRLDIYRNRWGLVCESLTEYFADVRAAHPAHFEFAFDGHAAIWEPAKAIQLGNSLAPYDPLFFEEPIRPEYYPAWGRLRDELRVPLATGECLYTVNEFLALLAHQGADIIQPDICIVGGLTQMRKIATIAAAHYVPVAPHNPMGPLATAANVHFAASTSNFKILEYKTDQPAWCVDPYLPVDGFLELREDRPGWGVEIDEGALSGDDYVHWERSVPTLPDGSTAYV